jgi:hypothetical protein
VLRPLGSGRAPRRFDSETHPLGGLAHTSAAARKWDVVHACDVYYARVGRARPPATNLYRAMHEWGLPRSTTPGHGSSPPRPRRGPAGSTPSTAHKRVHSAGLGAAGRVADSGIHVRPHLSTRSGLTFIGHRDSHRAAPPPRTVACSARRRSVPGRWPRSPPLLGEGLRAMRRRES